MFSRSTKLAFALLLLSLSAVGQSTFGSIEGSVTDPSGAAMSSAMATIVNDGAGVSRTVVVTEGRYRALNLEPGTYSVTIKADNFAPATEKSITLLAREIRRIDFKLQVAAAGTTVDVKGDAAVVSESLTISTSKSGDTINSLALNFRATTSPSPIVVSSLSPGVQTDQSGQYSFSGGLPNSTSFSIDGISTQNVRGGGPSSELFPSVESIGEFRVNTAGNSAEFAQATDLTVISKSGTNDFHGTGFWYFQRDDFNAANPITNTKQKVQADDFGVSLGGPIWIPKVYNGRNKTFFFFTYEGIRRPQDILLNQIVPPTPWRSGDLSSVAKPILNPFTGTPFPGNKIPSNLLNPVSQKILSALFVQPNSPTNASIAAPNYTANFPGNYETNAYDGRLDQNIGDRHRFFFRWSQKQVSDVGTGGSGNYNVQLGPNTSATTGTNIGSSWNWVITPTIINEFRAGYTFYQSAFNQYPLARQGDALVKSFGINGLPPSPVNGLGGVPEIEISSFLGGTSSPGHPRQVDNRILDFRDNISWIKGAHTFKAGFDFRRLSYKDQITFLTGDEYGDYFFLGLVTGNDFADFLLGTPAATAFAQNGPDGRPFGYHYGGFFQDDWRIARGVTLNLGLRYEYNTPFNDETNQLGQFDRNFPGGRLITQGDKGLALVAPSWRRQVGNTPFVTNLQAGLPITLRNADKTNVQPRAGISWNLGNNNKTIVRASGGLYSVPVLGAVLYSLLGVNTSNFVQFNTSATNPLVFPNPFGGNAADLGFPSYRRANQTDLKDPKVAQWNVSVDRDLGWNTLLRLNYTGSYTYNLIYSPDLNQVRPNNVGYAALTATPALRAANLKYPNFNEVLTRDNGPISKYNAFSVEVNRRFARDLTFTNSYTLAKQTTNALGSAPASNTPNGGTTGGDNGNNVLNYYDIQSDIGDAPFTRRHRFVSTFVYDLPFGRGKAFGSKVSRVADLAVGGWRLTGVTYLQSGTFLTPTFTGTDPSGTNPAQRSAGNFQRPDCVAGVSGNASNPTRDQYFNPSAFSVPANAIGRFGNCGVGILNGPGTKTFSMGVGKQFQIYERFSVRYEAQFSNLFNFVNLGTPNTRFSNAAGTVNPSFGRITSVQSAEQAGPRIIQMLLRVQF